MKRLWLLTVVGMLASCNVANVEEPKNAGIDE